MRWKGPLAFRGSDGPIARSNDSAERATVAWHSLGKLRSTRNLPPRTAPSRGGFPVRRPMSLTLGPVPAFANSGSPVFIDLGSPFLVAFEISIAAGRLLQSATRPESRFLEDGPIHPQEWTGYPQAGRSCPPVHPQAVRGDLSSPWFVAAPTPPGWWRPAFPRSSQDKHDKRGEAGRGGAKHCRTQVDALRRDSTLMGYTCTGRPATGRRGCARTRKAREYLLLSMSGPSCGSGGVYGACGSIGLRYRVDRSCRRMASRQLVRQRSRLTRLQRCATRRKLFTQDAR